MAGLPSARDLTLGKEGMFAECQILDTRQRIHVAECQVRDTRQKRRDRLRAVALLFFPERRFQLSAKYLPSADRKHSAKRRLPAL